MTAVAAVHDRRTSSSGKTGEMKGEASDGHRPTLQEPL